MQLFAYDDQKKVISASHANKQIDYFCLECAGIVRRRGGIHRHTHFYHLSSGKSCRQNGKSMEHLQVQFAIRNKISEEECLLEHPFLTINRIADVVWKTKGIVFEIQCSPITAQEVKERNQDYQSQGFRVVWILHDKRFNQRRLSAAEQFLLDQPHYFTNMDEEGCGIIYDQHETIGIKREKLWGPHPIDVAEYKEIQEKDQSQIKSWLIPRIKREIYFSGDLLSHFLSDPSQFDFIKEEEKPVTFTLRKAFNVIRHTFIRAYSLFFQVILERACK